MTALSLNDVTSFKPGKIPVNSANLNLASGILQKLWDEHQKSLFIKPDGVRVGSSKFAALLAREVFGGTLAGNSDHVFVLHNDIIVDLNVSQPDVKALDMLAHIDTPHAISGVEFREKLGLCMPAVERWAKVVIDQASAPDRKRSPARDESHSLAL
jgi:hypothetical protein